MNQSFNSTGIGSGSMSPWTNAVIVALFIRVNAVLINGAVLLMFIQYSHLRTSFSVYVVLLLSFNALIAFMSSVFDISENIYDKWMMGQCLCTIKIYNLWVFSGCIRYTHVLITANRIWAILFPVQYRNYHSKKIAVMLCSCMIACVHIIGLPLIIKDALFYQPYPSENHCFLNERLQPKLSAATNLMMLTLPIAVVVATYPFICYKKRKRMMQARPTKETRTAVEDIWTDSRQLAIFEPVIQKPIKVKTSQTPILVLTTMTVSMTVFWLPFQVVDYLDSKLILQIPLDLYDVFWVMSKLLLVLGPILLAMTLTDLRATVSSYFRCSWCSIANLWSR